MLNPTLSRMKSLLSPSLSTLSPILSNPRSSFPPISLPLMLNFPSFSAPLSPSFLHEKPMFCHNSSSSNGFSLNKEGFKGPSGEIHVVLGPMFAGKTTTLLRRVRAESLDGRRVAIIKSDKDTRYGLESIVTHDGEKFPCWPLSHLSSFKQRIGPDVYDKLEVIGIDEAQFFGDLYDFCSEVADYDGKTVIVAGLDGDYLRRRFGSLLDIIPIADSVTKLNARCELCDKRALFTLRKTGETKTELIAGADVYMPVCRKHYVSGQVVKETTRTILEKQKDQCGSLLS
ncbi:hypothetical protein ACET3Z_004724 [Daucus carota]